MQPLIVDNATKCFGAVHALDGVDLTVEQGHFLAIMGASGSGKSTLLHLMAGLTRPSTGRILVNESDLAAMNDRQLTRFRQQHIGLIFQAFNLIPTLTAAQNIALPLQLAGAGGDLKAKVDYALERMGLSARRDHRPDGLSGGEQQRVAIARALITEPAVILADEPTGNLDSATSRAICELMVDLNRNDGATIILVTHEPDVAMYATETVLIRDGKLVDRFETSRFADAGELANHYHQQLSGPAS